MDEFIKLLKAGSLSLHEMLKDNKIINFRLLLELSIETEDLDTIEWLGTTLNVWADDMHLIHAVKNNKLRVVMWLIEHGKRMDLARALNTACGCGYTEIVVYLLKWPYVQSIDRCVDFAVTNAINGEYLDILEILHASGKVLRAEHLCSALTQKKTEIANWLFSKGLKLGYSHLKVFVSEGSAMAVRWILENQSSLVEKNIMKLRKANLASDYAGKSKIQELLKWVSYDEDD